MHRLQLSEVKGKTVYDLGGGGSYFAFPLVRQGARVVVADPDRRFLAYLLGRRDALDIPSSRLEVRPIPYDDPLLRRGGRRVVCQYVAHGRRSCSLPRQAACGDAISHRQLQDERRCVVRPSLGA